MTPTLAQILALPAGRELDALVAEYVMGDGSLAYPEGAHKRWYNVSRDAFNLHYSTNMADAFLVVDKMKGFFELIRAIGYGGIVTWYVHVGLEVEASAESAPLAICRAALLSAESVNVNAMSKSSAPQTASPAPVPPPPTGEGWGSL